MCDASLSCMAQFAELALATAERVIMRPLSCAPENLRSCLALALAKRADLPPGECHLRAGSRARPGRGTWACKFRRENPVTSSSWIWWGESLLGRAKIRWA